MKKCLAALIMIALISFPAYADVNWAFVGPLTGSAANYGIMDLVGAQQAVEDINKSGGINKDKIVLKTFDDACDPKQAVAVANRIVAEGVHFVIQGDCSSSSIASAKVFSEESIVVLNPLATNPKYTDQGGVTIFRTIYRDDDAAPVLAQIVLKRFPTKKLAIVHDKSAYGFGLADEVRKRLNAAGIKEASFDSYDPANRDFSALVTHLRESGIETLFIGGYPVEIATITRQMHEAGLKIQVIAGDLSDNDFWKIAGPAGDGALFVFPRDSKQKEGTRAVQAVFMKKKQDYNGLTLYAYASVQLLAEAIKATSAADPAAVAKIIHQKSFDTILGAWRFDQKGDVQNIPLVLYRWHDGKYEEIAE